MAQHDAAIEAILREASRLRQQGQTHRERALLDDAVAAHPTAPALHNARGLRALADQAFDIAISSFANAVAADPTEPALRLNLAAAYRAKGDVAGERQSLQDTLDLDQLHFMARLRLAELLQREGDLTQAAQHWSAVLQIARSLTERSDAILEIERRARRFLDEHNAAYARALEAELGGPLAETETSYRFKACAEHTLGRRKIYHNECAGVHFPFLPADEFFDRAHFPWLAELEAATPQIRAEALALIANGTSAIRPYVRLDAGTPQNKWSPLDQSLEWSACFLWEQGTQNEAICALCPATAAALARVPQTEIPGKAPSAFFSILQAKGKIPPHTGVTNTRSIVHLPLVVPEGCGFRVGGETRPWREGEAFVFDDTIEHEAWNTSDQLRVVLIFDVWNPHLTVAEQEHLKKLFAVADLRNAPKAFGA
ncbi:hypothetical protein DBR17_17070 [Sphingomonas sp. HMWF008]|nr:hypothetical protein DBR17_17070 [Sphingomonas sp. HMWF008]